MIDVNASLGQWPFGKLRYNTPSSLLKLMDSVGIDQACVAPIEGLLYGDVQLANRQMHRAVRQYRQRLLPFSVINPSLPGWKEDLEECDKVLNTVGIRLFPSYHGYRISDKLCLELFDQLQRRNLPVQIAPVVSDPRTDHPQVAIRPAKLDAVPQLPAMFPALRLALINVNMTVKLFANPKHLRRVGSVFFDIAWAEGVCCIQTLIETFGVDKILFGTNAPLMIPLAAVYKLQEADLNRSQQAAITRTNALAFLGKRRKYRS